MKKVLFLTEYIHPPYDEGIKKTSNYIREILSAHYETITFCLDYQKKEQNIYKFNRKRLLLSISLYFRIKKINPNVIVYLPFMSSTNGAYLRFKLFSIAFPFTHTALFCLQPKNTNKSKILFNLLKPSIGITISQKLFSYWNSQNVQSFLLPVYTNLTKFKILENKEEKELIRKKYGFFINDLIILHIGHLNESRNLRALIPLAKNGYKVVVVTSSSTPIDAKGTIELRVELEEQGIKFICGYIEDIQELYWLADLYIFPIVYETGSIDIPLSILEARACGIPVLTTDFGSVRKFLDNDNGSIVYSNPDEFRLNAKKILESSFIKKSRAIEDLNISFKNTFLKIIDQLISKNNLSF